MKRPGDGSDETPPRRRPRSTNPFLPDPDDEKDTPEPPRAHPRTRPTNQFLPDEPEAPPARPSPPPPRASPPVPLPAPVTPIASRAPARAASARPARGPRPPIEDSHTLPFGLPAIRPGTRLEEDGSLTVLDVPPPAPPPPPRPSPRRTPTLVQPTPIPTTVVEAPAARAPRSAEWYGPYLILRRVAVGGMAEVFMAKQGGIGGFEKVVAIKRLLPHLARDQGLVDMFINEAKVVAGLSHPHIVQIFALGKLGASYYIAMEYVHGRDLRSIERRAADRGLRVPIDIAVFIARQIAASLGYAHRKADDQGRPLKIIHRDVSPQNILVSYDGEVKLTDFGIARAVTRATVNVQGLLRGKLAYMSPEQAAGKPTPRSDIFSLGVVLYGMLTGERPLKGDSETTMLQAVKACRIAPPRSLNPRIPASVEEIVMKALSRDPDERYHDAVQFERALELGLGDKRPASAKELTRFMDVLYDRSERGPSGARNAPGEGLETPEEFEVELEGMEPDAEPLVPTGPSRDDMSIEKLLDRFRRPR